MFYTYTVNKQDDGSWTGMILDLNVKASGETKQEVVDIFSKGISTIIESDFRKKRKPIPLPTKHTDVNPVDGGVLYVPIKLQLRILLWNELRKRHMTGVEFADLIGVSRQMAQKYLDASGGVSVEKYEEAFLRLGITPTVLT